VRVTFPPTFGTGPRTFTIVLSGASPTSVTVVKPVGTATLIPGNKITVWATDDTDAPLAGISFEAVAPDDPSRAYRATTDGSGVAKIRVPDGTYWVRGVHAPGIDPKTMYPVRSGANCATGWSPQDFPPNPYCSVTVTGGDEASVKFEPCVQPTPDGQPLPKTTPNPVPGSVQVGQLEAVGCFSSDNESTFTSRTPVRLNGIDVVPRASIEVLKPTAEVKATGPSVVYLFGQPAFAPGMGGGLGGGPQLNEPIDWYYNIGSTKINDLGTTPPTARVAFPNLAGLPILDNLVDKTRTLSGKAVGISVENVPGQSTLTISLLLSTPFTGGYDFLAGKFKSPSSTFGKLTSDPGVEVQLSAITTNRYGFAGFGKKLCAKAADFKPFEPWFGTQYVNKNLGKVKAAVKVCFVFPPGGGATSQTIEGKMELPVDESEFGTRPTLTVAGTLEERPTGTVLKELTGQLDTYNKPVGAGIYFQRLYVDWLPNYADLWHSTWTVGAGFSLGPQVSLAKYGSVLKGELLSFDGNGTLSFGSGVPYLSVNGTATLLKNTVLALPFGSANVKLELDGVAQVHLAFDLSHGPGKLVPGPTGPLAPIIRIENGSVDGTLNVNSSDFRLTGHATVELLNLLGFASLKKFPATVTMDAYGITACTTLTQGGQTIGVHYGWATGFQTIKGGPCAPKSSS